MCPVAPVTKYMLVPFLREPWEPETTARNLRLVREAPERRAEDVTWLAEIEAQLGRLAQATVGEMPLTGG